MKKKDITSLRSKSLDELSKIGDDRKVELSKKQASLYAAKEKNLKSGKNLRLEIAQIKTLIREKEILKSEDKAKEN